MYYKPYPLPESFPRAVTVDGNPYSWTGKNGTHRPSGQCSAEYESEAGDRVWRCADGTIELS